jgi:hypothetical protein
MRPDTRFCLILLTIGSLFLGVGCKETETQVTDPDPLGGFTLTGQDPGNFTLPSGWNLRCSQDFENNTIHPERHIS